MAFVKEFLKKYSVEGVVWINVKKAVEDINIFIEKLIEVVLMRWKNSYVNTDFGKKVFKKTLLIYLSELLYKHLIKLYSMQMNNRRKEEKLKELKNLTLQDLDVPDKLLLAVC